MAGKTHQDPHAARAYLAEFCASEPWSGELGSGLLRLEDMSCQVLGLHGGNNQGLLSLVQCFAAEDRNRILDVFERAATAPYQFCFSSTIASRGKAGQTVLCIGKSHGHGPSNAGMIDGVFIFPHL